MKKAATCLLLAAGFVGGLAWGQEEKAAKGDLAERLAGVRREIKIIDLDTSLKRVPAMVERENAYAALLAEMRRTDAAGGELAPLLERGRALKLAALDDLNSILKLHRGKYVGLSEEEVWQRLRSTRFTDVEYRNEWLVNILDDLEESCKINIELDARVYKFDTVSFDFDKTSARAMLQMMGDQLLFNWIIRGDTLYVYKERHETLFGGEWIRKKKAAWRARKKALEEAAKEAERRALGEDK